ncbi:MAG TPA: glycoside hydrolase family 30 beta sandwich domain-containing protein [Balneolales bacterium]|nr:glycoside hydrolase family 30 beta sandwich domain-containing protein [Balneolales bacterium]
MTFRYKSLLLITSVLFVTVSLGCSNKPTSVNGPIDPPPAKDTTSTQPVDTDVNLWLTKADKSVLFEKQNVSLKFSSKSKNVLTIYVDTTQQYQSIDGFGFALTGGSAKLIYRLPSDKRSTLLHNLFSTDSTSIGVSYLRLSIGSSDLNQNVFSYDDIPQGQTDTTLKQFDLGPDLYNVVPLLKEIVAINPNIQTIATPWSAPVWMKTNDSSVGGSLNPQYYKVYAQYFVNYVQAMEANGIPITAVTPQNEPLYGGNNPSMLMSAGEEANFVKNYLGPAFKDAGLKTKIVVYDHNCDRPDYPLSILADSEANKYVDGSAFHLYGGEISALSQVHNSYPDKNVYFTEQWTGGPGNFSEDLNWHVKNLIIGATRNWSKNVLEWNLASDPNYDPHTPGGCSTCMGALTIGTTITRNVSYYIIASAAKFVRPGSVRIGSNNMTNLQNVAFKTPDGKKVLIVLNDSNSRQSFDINFSGRIVSTALSGGAVGSYVWK